MANLGTFAGTAPDAAWLKASYSGTTSAGAKRYLLKVKGLCAAYSAEVIAHFLTDNTRSVNLRHKQSAFTYKFETADQWGRFLRGGGDSNLGKWVSKSAWKPQAGDTLFWMKGVNGYRYSAGHVGIVVEVQDSGTIIISENSSSRGIGVHRITQVSLATLGGAFRWDASSPPLDPADLLIIRLPDNVVIDCNPVIEDGVTRCDLRPLAEALGYIVHGQHVSTQGKIYLEPKPKEVT